MIVRALTAEDADELAALLAESREWLAPHEPVRDERFFTPDGQRERIQNEGSRAFAILADDRIAGAVTISNIVHGPFQSGSLGYWIAEPFSGRGLTTRAVGAVVAIAFTDLTLHRLEAATPIDNVPSQRVLEKNGFELIGLARRYLEIAGEWSDHLLFQRAAD